MYTYVYVYITLYPTASETQPNRLEIILRFGFTTEDEGQPPLKRSEKPCRAAGGINMMPKTK